MTARIKKFKLTSGGAAYTLNVGFVPDEIEVWNYTQWAVDTKTAKSYWHRGMTTAYALNELCEDTSTNHTASTSNGFTVLETTSIVPSNQSISAVTAANPPVVTVGATATYTTGDVVGIHDVTGMTQINENHYKITVINSTTFSLQDMNGDDIDGSAYTAWSAGGKVVNVSEKVDNSGTFRVTLGTDVVGADSDLLFVTCTQADYEDLGDIG